MSQLLRRLVVLEPGEAPALLASFATLLCTFSSYTILRPVRDALWAIFFFAWFRDRPEDQPRVSPEERELIRRE